MSRSLYKTILTNKVFLVQTDTTVGFLSQNGAELARIKERPESKPFVRVVSSFKHLKQISRIPPLHKNRVRRSKKVTFVYPNNNAVRRVTQKEHADFIRQYGWFYSTSANEKSLAYDTKFAFAKSDIIVEDNRGLYEGEASQIYKLLKTKIKRLR